MTTRFTLNVTSDNLDQEGKGLSQNATMMSDNPEDIIAALSQLAGVNRASNNYGAQEVYPEADCGCDDERVKEGYANEPDTEVYSVAGGVGDLVDTGHTAKAKNRYTKAGFGDNPLAETDDEEEDDWYDKDGRPNPHGAFDAAGHYYPERDNQYEEADEQRFSAALMREWTEDKLQSVSQEFDVDAAMEAIFEGKEQFTQGSKQFVVRKDADVVKVFPLMENRTIMTMPLLVLDAAALVKEAEVSEKAVSQAQQQAAGAALAAKRGDAPKSELKGASKEMMGMSTSELEKFAGTKHKGLPKHVGEDTVSEDQDSIDAVAGAVTRRIMMQHTDILSKYGPVKVMAAIDDVAQFAGSDGLDEIGSSDVSIWVKQVIQDLEAGHFDHVDEDLAEAGVTEGDFVGTLGAIAAARYQPKVGDKIRTRKGGQIPGTVEKVGEVGGIEYCWFRHPEGKMYKTPCSNVMREGVDEEQVDEVSKDTLDSYADKASAERDEFHAKRNDSADDARKYFNRKNGVRQALAKTDAMENIEMDEELQQIRALAGMHEAKVDEEDVEENAYNQAAAAAARSGAKEFEFPKGSGKMHPTKMDKATAHQMGESDEGESHLVARSNDSATDIDLDIVDPASNKTVANVLGDDFNGQIYIGDEVYTWEAGGERITDAEGNTIAKNMTWDAFLVKKLGKQIKDEGGELFGESNDAKVDEDADFDYMMSLLNKWR